MNFLFYREIENPPRRKKERRKKKTLKTNYLGIYEFHPDPFLSPLSLRCKEAFNI